MRSFRSTALWSLLLAALLLALPACDSDSGDDDNGDLDGTYAFQRFEFDVSGFNTQINVLDTLAVSNLDLLGGNETFTLTYRFEGDDGGRSVISGDYNVDGDEVMFDVESGDRDRLLLPNDDDFRLDITGDGMLSGSIPRRNVDLSAFGIDQPNLNGTLEIRLQRQQ